MMGLVCLVGMVYGEVSEEDRVLNRYIEEYIPVYDASQLGVTTLRAEDIFYEPDAFSTTHVIGYFKVGLLHANKLKFEPHSSFKHEFIGYGDENSKVQIYLKPARFSYFFSMGEAFGDPIDLKAGSYSIVHRDRNLGEYRITVNIVETELAIKVLSSGWLENEYGKARVMVVRIVKVEKVK